MSAAVNVALVVVAVFLPIAMHAAAVFILNRAHSRGSTIMALLERLRVAQAGLAGSIIIAALVINGALGRPWNPDVLVLRLVTAFGLLIMALPSGVFVYLYLSNKFGDDSAD